MSRRYSRKGSLNDVYGFGPHNEPRAKPRGIVQPPTLPTIQFGPREVQQYTPTPLISSSTPPPPPPPGKLHTPTFNPNGSVNSNTQVTINCIDGGSHLFYTIGASPADPTHSGDTPTGGTIRIGSNTGTVNSGAGQTRIKALAYQSGMTDSDIATSNTFGSIVSPLRPILNGFGQITPLNYDFVGDSHHYQGWFLPYVDFFRMRFTWNALEATEGVYTWTSIDAAVAKALATGKFLSINIAAGNNTPGWVYSNHSAQQVTLSNGSTMPLPWDSRYAIQYGIFINAFAAHIATLPGADQIRLIFDCGWMPDATMQIGTTADETMLISTALTGYGYSGDYTGLTNAYMAGGLAVAALWFSAFPYIGHAVTQSPVFNDNYGGQLRQQFLQQYIATQTNRIGKMNTSAFAQHLIPFPGPPVGSLIYAPSCAQEVVGMILANGSVNSAGYQPPPPSPLPPPITAIQDAMETRWSDANSYFEIYQGDIEYPGITDMMLIEQGKVKGNLLLPP